LMPDWKARLTGQLEPLLKLPDPRQQISAYHDMPYAIFRYPPEEEFPLRQEIALLRTRLEQIGKRVTVISLAECLSEALEAEDMGTEALVDAEKSVGLDATVETVFQILSEYQPLDELVARRIPQDADPLRDVVFIVRAGALYPMYRTSALLEQLKGKVQVPAVLFYPGELDGAAGLRFMGVLDAEHNYRPKIF
ncbi:MAG: BREX protein BrxB domain-containing protein, partial [Chromatiaceae bacterium]